MKRSLLSMIAVGGVAVAFALPAAASQKGVNACQKTFGNEGNKTIKAIIQKFKGCEDKIASCLAKAVADQPACLAGLLVAGKACAADVLDANANAGCPTIRIGSGWYECTSARTTRTSW